MIKERNVKDTIDLTSGPGKSTKALAITKALNGTYVTKRKSEIVTIEGEGEDFEVCSSQRIGVKLYLPQEFGFFIKGNKFFQNSVKGFWLQKLSFWLSKSNSKKLLISAGLITKIDINLSRTI